MLRSMTGYGRSEQPVGDRTFLIELKSLNGKQFELQLKLPQILKAHEFDIRSLVAERMVRGSVECIVTLKQNGASKPVTINTELAKAYYRQLRDLAENVGLDTGNIMDALLRLPEVVAPSADTFDAQEWMQFREALLQALAAMDAHRDAEGAALERDLRLRIANITALQREVARLDPLRKERIRAHLLRLLTEQVGADKYDGNRMEQELIYYMEKMDITEEQVRLENHCGYFLSLLDLQEPTKGKKLSFVLQEIGREINTTGSKANDAEIQKTVVMMKDELEKAKEQVLNVL